MLRDAVALAAALVSRLLSFGRLHLRMRAPRAAGTPLFRERCAVGANAAAAPFLAERESRCELLLYDRQLIVVARKQMLVVPYADIEAIEYRWSDPRPVLRLRLTGARDLSLYSARPTSALRILAAGSSARVAVRVDRRGRRVRA